jgi:hypothetical protein
MKKTLNIDEELFKQAKIACGAATDTETVRLGLEAWCVAPRMSAFGSSWKRAARARCSPAA